MHPHPARRPLRLLLALPLTLGLGVGVALAQTPGSEVERPSSFTSEWTVEAGPDQVPQEDGERGNPDASGTYRLQFDSTSDVVCFDIELTGIDPSFDSPAATATHIHRGFAGIVGPPVVLFPDPQPSGDGTLSSEGCLEAPFNPDEEFTLADIEAAPANYYVDVHTEAFPRGDVRGQMTTARVDTASASGGEADDDAMPAEGRGVAAGFGGAASEDRSVPIALAVLTLVLAAAATTRALVDRRVRA